MKKILFTGIILVWNIIIYAQIDIKQNVLADKKTDSIARAEILQEFINSTGKSNTLTGNQVKTDIEYVDYYENGQLNSKGKFKEGEKFGEWIQYWEDGKTRYKGSFENGIKIGEWIEYDKEGNVIIKGNYTNGQIVSYRSDEQKIREVQNYVNGKLNGENIFYDTKGRIRETFIYKDGIKIEETFYDKGTFIFKKTFDLEGRVLQVIGNGNVDTSETIDTFDSDVSTKEKEKVRNGQVIIKNKNGSVGQICNYLNGNLNGNYKELYKGKIVALGNYKNDEPIGEWTMFYATGKLKFKGNCSSFGKYIKLDIEGEGSEGQRLESLLSYDSFRFEGNCTFYYGNGTIYIKGNFTNGKVEYFARNGKIYKTESYINGKLNGESDIYFFIGRGIESLAPEGSKVNEDSFEIENLKVIKKYYLNNVLIKSEVYIEKETNDNIWKTFSLGYCLGGNEDNESVEFIIYNNQNIVFKGYYTRDFEEKAITNEKPEEYKNGTIKYYDRDFKNFGDGYFRYNESSGKGYWARLIDEDAMAYDGSYDVASKYFRKKVDFPADGEAILYFSNGKVYKKCNFKNGKINGKMIEYYENGKIQSIMNYRNGVFDCRSED